MRVVTIAIYHTLDDVVYNMILSNITNVVGGVF
jgi:hypothetical protein